jgi:hypothetical protein
MVNHLKFRHFFTTLAVTVVFLQCAQKPLFAQSSFRLELGNRGTASVTLKLKVRDSGGKNASADHTVVNTLVLPFQLDNGFRVSKPDDVDLSVLSNRDGYCVLSIVTNNADTEITIHIDDAFKLLDERTRGRVKFTCDNSYGNMRQHRGILALPSTISEYEITIALPQVYRKDELSFEPPQDQWKEDQAGKAYTLPTSAPGHAAEVWIAFPSPSKGNLQVAQISISVVVGLFLLVAGGKLGLERKLGPLVLFATLFLTLTVIFLVVYFGRRVTDPQELLAWAAGPLVPVLLAPFVCAWLLFAPRFEAELSGNVKLDDGPPDFVEVWLFKTKKSGESSRKKVKLNEDGNYHVYVWCGNSTPSVHLVASGAGTSEGKSNEIELSAKLKVAVSPINLQRLKARSEPTTSR